MKDLRELGWLAIEAKALASAPPPPMDKRVLTFGFLRRRIGVKLLKLSEFEDEMVTWLVFGLRSAKAQ